VNSVRRGHAVLLIVMVALLSGAAVHPARSASRLAPVRAADTLVSRCLPADTVADDLLDTLRAMATQSTKDPAMRRAKLHLPLLASAREVQQITTGPRCVTAARAADSAWSSSGVSRRDPQRRVYLFAFGDLFVVISPARDPSGLRPMSSFTPIWKYLATTRF